LLLNLLSSSHKMAAKLIHKSAILFAQAYKLN